MRRATCALCAIVLASVSATAAASKSADVRKIPVRSTPATTAKSQSTGAGAGKVTFNPFSINRKIDKASPSLR